MEKYVLIVENGTESLKKNESAQSTSKFLLSGPFTEFDIENRNKRFYTAKNFIPVMNSLLEKRKMLGVLYGEFDHPDVFDIAGKNASHAIESLVHNEAGNRVDGSIALLSTHYGKEARAIINDGYPLFVSSRAAGVTDGNGNVALKELFTYDIVLDPGFASARVSVNESFGLKSTQDVPYRIYEMKDEQVNNLFVDNKNDGKTAMDLKHMEMVLATEMAKIEHQILSKLGENKYAPEELKALLEKQEVLNDELASVKEYLEFFKVKVSHLVSENSKIVSENKKLLYEINENTAYSNHIASQLKNLNKYTVDIETRLSVDEKMIEYVAEHAKANILFSEDIANNVTKISEAVSNNAEFLEYVAAETEIAQKFAENVAAETEIAQKFAESIALEVKDTQGFLEHVATEANKDEIFLSYIAEKVDGIIGYNLKSVQSTKLSIPVTENASTDNIHSLETIVEFLGIEEEQEVVNNIENGEAAEAENAEVPEVESEVPAVTEVEPVSTEATPDSDVTLDVQPTDVPAAMDVDALGDTTVAEVQPEGEPNMKTDLVNALVKIMGTDETGVVINVTDDKITIQKSGSDETSEHGHDEYEVLNQEENVAEKVAHVLSEVKKQKVLANQRPHFFNFLSEQQIEDFKLLESTYRDAITLELYNSEYYNTEDVLRIIGGVINEKTMSYEERLVSNVPVAIKETWNGLAQEQKQSIVAESKYFNLVTNADIANFWNTRPFAKAVLGPEATLIKESVSAVDTEVLSDKYIQSFLKTMDNFNTK
jgi:hypothetical protein